MSYNPQQQVPKGQISIEEFEEDFEEKKVEEKKSDKNLDDFLDDDEENPTPAPQKKPTIKPLPKTEEEEPAPIPSILSDEQMSKLHQDIKEEIKEKMQKMEIKVDEAACKAIESIVVKQVNGLSSRIVKEVKEQLNLTTHVIEIPKHEPIITDHPYHCLFEDVLFALQSDEIAYLYGEAGTGKSKLAEDIAKTLGYRLLMLTATDVVNIFGYKDITSTFVETAFTEWFMGEKVLLYISEFDSIDPNAALQLNTAFANKVTRINGKDVRRGDTTYCICDGNTSGNGADFNYSGRNKLDISSLDRFTSFEFDYDRNIEMYLSKNNVDLCDFADKFRAIVRKNDIPCVVTYRFIQRMVKFEEKFGVEKTFDRCLLRGMNQDDLAVIYKEIKSVSGNKYVTRFVEMCNSRGIR